MIPVGGQTQKLKSKKLFVMKRKPCHEKEQA
jgi:hypothetical protein